MFRSSSRNGNRVRLQLNSLESRLTPSGTPVAGGDGHEPSGIVHEVGPSSGDSIVVDGDFVIVNSSGR